jgi:glycosyltransferase involved in cell wall biosynthesis
MPYWQRRHVLADTLKTYRDLYPSEDLEIVIVDDGSPEPPGPEAAEAPARVVALPQKTQALNPCVPFNRGVAAARGDIIVLTNPEVVHKTPILAHMREHLLKLGPRGYVAAACWSPEHRWWFCHSELQPDPKKVGRAKMPDGAGLHFCAMLYRDFFAEVGGFDEIYRGGQGYDDNDLLWKLHAAGAVFHIADDLVTEHVACPRTQWPGNGHDRNRVIFEGKWGV